MPTLEIKAPYRYIEVRRPDGSLLSRHVTIEDAIESAANAPPGVIYEILPPRRTVRVIGSLAPQTGDTEAPSIPGLPSLVSRSATTIAVTASASTDNVGVTGYQWYLNGTPITTTVNPSHTFTGLTPSTNYAVTASAFDAAGNSSAQSQTLNTATLSNAAPVWNIGLQALTTNQSYFLDLLSVCSDADTNPITFSIISGTLPTGITFNSVAKTVSGTPTVVQTQAVTFRASDGIVNTDQVITFEVLNADTTAPPVPTMNAASGITSSGMTVSCSTVSDTVVADARTSGGVQYIFQRATDSGFTAGIVTEPAQAGTSCNITGLAAGTLYYFRVRSVDAAGNQSAFSSGVHAVTVPQATMYFQDGGETGNTSPWSFVGGDGTSPSYPTSGGADGNAFAGTRFFSWVLNNGDNADDHSLVYEVGGSPATPNPTIRNGFLQFSTSYGGTFGLGSGEQKLAIIQFYRQSSPSFSNVNRKYQIIPCVLANGRYAVGLTEMDNSGNFLRNAFIQQASTTFGPGDAANQWDTLRLEWVLDTNGSQVGSEYGAGFGNGVIRLWRNNTLIIEATNVNIVRAETVVVGRAFATPSHSPHVWTAATQNIYYDQYQLAGTAAPLAAMPSGVTNRLAANNNPDGFPAFTAVTMSRDYDVQGAIGENWPSEVKPANTAITPQWNAAYGFNSGCWRLQFAPSGPDESGGWLGPNPFGGASQVTTFSALIKFTPTFLNSVGSQGFLASPAKVIDLGTSPNRHGIHLGRNDFASAAHGSYVQFIFAGTGGGNYIPTSRDSGAAADLRAYAGLWCWLVVCWDGRSAQANQRTLSIYLKAQGVHTTPILLGRVFEGESWNNRFGQAQVISFQWGSGVPGVQTSPLFGFWDDVVGATLDWANIQFYLERARILVGWPTGIHDCPF